MRPVGAGLNLPGFNLHPKAAADFQDRVVKIEKLLQRATIVANQLIIE